MTQLRSAILSLFILAVVLVAGWVFYTGAEIALLRMAAHH